MIFLLLRLVFASLYGDVVVRLMVYGLYGVCMRACVCVCVCV